MPTLPDQLPRPRSAPPGTGGSRNALDPATPMLQVAGGLGLAGVVLGMTILIFSCAGLDAALEFCPAVIVLGMASGVICFISSLKSNCSDVSVLACAFLSLLALCGGTLELTALMRWPILFIQH